MQRTGREEGVRGQILTGLALLPTLVPACQPQCLETHHCLYDRKYESFSHLTHSHKLINRSQYFSVFICVFVYLSRTLIFNTDKYSVHKYNHICQSQHFTLKINPIPSRFFE